MVFTDGIGAVQGVIQRAPTRIGGVQSVTCIQDGHHQLRAGQLGQLGIDVLRCGFGVFGLSYQVADLAQKLLIRLHRLALCHRTGVGGVPSVHGRLNAVALGQQRAIFWRQFGNQSVKTLPKRLALDTGCRQHLVLNKAIQGGGHLQAVNWGAFSHEKPRM